VTGTEAPAVIMFGLSILASISYEAVTNAAHIHWAEPNQPDDGVERVGEIASVGFCLLSACGLGEH